GPAFLRFSPWLTTREKRTVAPTCLEPLVTAEDAARLAGVQVRTIYKWAAAGRMPPPVGPSSRRLRWRREGISSWLAARPADELEGLLERAAALTKDEAVKNWLLALVRGEDAGPVPAPTGKEGGKA